MALPQRDAAREPKLNLKLIKLNQYIRNHRASLLAMMLMRGALSLGAVQVGFPSVDYPGIPFSAPVANAFARKPHKSSPLKR
jgi:hypothetical protein